MLTLIDNAAKNVNVDMLFPGGIGQTALRDKPTYEQKAPSIMVEELLETFDVDVAVAFDELEEGDPVSSEELVTYARNQLVPILDSLIAQLRPDLYLTAGIDHLGRVYAIVKCPGRSGRWTYRFGPEVGDRTGTIVSGDLSVQRTL